MTQPRADTTESPSTAASQSLCGCGSTLGSAPRSTAAASGELASPSSSARSALLSKAAGRELQAWCLSGQVVVMGWAGKGKAKLQRMWLNGKGVSLQKKTAHTQCLGRSTSLLCASIPLLQAQRWWGKRGENAEIWRGSDMQLHVEIAVYRQPCRKLPQVFKLQGNGLIMTPLLPVKC